MKMYEATGYVLSRRNIDEGDLLLEIFTLEHGRIKVVARGARKPRAKLRSHLEPFVQSDFRLVSGRQLDILVGVQNKFINPFLEANLDQKTSAYLLTEVIQKTTPENQPNQQIFSLYTNSLNKILSTNTKVILCYGILHILKVEGIEPELPSEFKKIFYFDLDQGNVSDLNSSGSIQLELDVVKLWKVLLGYSMSTVDRLNVENVIINASIEALCRYIEYHFHVRLKSLKVFQDTNC